MCGVFCQRLGISKTLFRYPGIHGFVRILSPLGRRTLSSSTVEEECNGGDVKAFHAYLVNSCGLSLEMAKCVSMPRRHFKPEIPDAVIKILRDYGFDDTQVSKLVKRAPQVIFSDAEKIVLPKLQFFSSMGIASGDLARLVTGNPALLTVSLKKSLVPKLEFLKTILVDNVDVIKAMKSNSRIFLVHSDRTLAANITSLREAGVPHHILQSMIKCFATLAIQSREKFVKSMKEVTKMGFHPSESTFVQAMHVFSSTREAGRDRKIDILRRCGMSESDIQSALKKRPHVLLVSDEKLMRNMEFLVKDMHWSPSDIARSPIVLHLSLENRLMPRSSVIRLLQSEGLVPKQLTLYTFLIINDKAFYDKFVAGYLGKIPQLLDVYQGKISASDLHSPKQQGC